LLSTRRIPLRKKKSRNLSKIKNSKFTGILKAEKEDKEEEEEKKKLNKKITSNFRNNKLFTIDMK